MMAQLPISCVNHVSKIVSDVEASTAFYRCDAFLQRECHSILSILLQAVQQVTDQSCTKHSILVCQGRTWFRGDAAASFVRLPRVMVRLVGPKSSQASSSLKTVQGGEK
jgi:hypothetical protein